MNYLVERAQTLYDNEQFAPVIALWSTAESAIQNVLAKDDEELLESIVSAPREALYKLLKHFEFERSKWTKDSLWHELSNGTPDGTAGQGATALHQGAEADRDAHMEECDALKRLVRGLDLPGNPLDLLIHRLGGAEAVAEMSGRKLRQTMKGGTGTGNGDSNGDSGEWQLENRSEGYDGLTSTSDINNAERQSFMDGRKKYAIITGAASAGISLHAERGCLNQRRRMMLVTELTWAADSTMQQFGRTHRSNQSSTPLYEIVVSSLGGESRFIGSITSRLQSLGALTKGDRGAAVGDVDGAGASFFLILLFFLFLLFFLPHV